MRLITIVDEMPVYEPEVRTIKEFNAILRRDGSKENDLNGRKKEKATKELSFVHFYCTFDSRFDLYETDEERSEAIKAAVGLPEDWDETDPTIRAAITRYDDMMKTESFSLIQKTRKAVKQLESFMETYDPMKKNKSGSLVFDPLKMQALSKGMPEMIEALNKAKGIVEKELDDKFNTGTKKAKALINSMNIDLEGEY